MTQVDCPYCRQPARLALGPEIWPDKAWLATKRFWVCDRCAARVGCYEGSDRPLGPLADFDMRAARHRAYKAFANAWTFFWNVKGGDRETFRNRMYQWLADQLQIPVDDCRFGGMDYKRLLKSVQFCEALLKQLRDRYGPKDLIPTTREEDPLELADGEIEKYNY